MGGNGPGTPPYHSSMDDMEGADQGIVNLACPSCAEVCSIDPSLFPVGETEAICSACENQLTILKAPDGSISVKGLPAQAPPAPGPVPPSQGVPQPGAARGQPAPAAGPKGPTRPVVCPKCLGRYRVPLSKIPKQGAWVTCPTCSERFIIKLDDLSFNEPPPAAKAKQVPIGSPIKETKPHMYRLWTQEQVGELEVTILDPVTPIVRRYWGIGLVIALALIFLAEALILRSSWRSANSMAELQQPSAPTVAAPYGEEELASDLRTLQADSVARNFVDREVNFTGPESRVYKYAVSRLAPNACQSITSLNLFAREPSAGLLLTATCYDPSGTAAAVKVVWHGREATLFIDGFERSGRLDSLIHPPAPSAPPAPGAVPDVVPEVVPADDAG